VDTGDGEHPRMRACSSQLRLTVANSKRSCAKFTGGYIDIFSFWGALPPNPSQGTLPLNTLGFHLQISSSSSIICGSTLTTADGDTNNINYTSYATERCTHGGQRTPMGQSQKFVKRSPRF